MIVGFKVCAVAVFETIIINFELASNQCSRGFRHNRCKFEKLH